MLWRLALVWGVSILWCFRGKILQNFLKMEETQLVAACSIGWKIHPKEPSCPSLWISHHSSEKEEKTVLNLLHHCCSWLRKLEFFCSVYFSPLQLLWKPIAVHDWEYVSFKSEHFLSCYYRVSRLWEMVQLHKANWALPLCTKSSRGYSKQTNKMMDCSFWQQGRF